MQATPQLSQEARLATFYSSLNTHRIPVHQVIRTAANRLTTVTLQSQYRPSSRVQFSTSPEPVTRLGQSLNNWVDAYVREPRGVDGTEINIVEKMCAFMTYSTALAANVTLDGERGLQAALEPFLFMPLNTALWQPTLPCNMELVGRAWALRGDTGDRTLQRTDNHLLVHGIVRVLFELKVGVGSGQDGGDVYTDDQIADLLGHIAAGAIFIDPEGKAKYSTTEGGEIKHLDVMTQVYAQFRCTETAKYLVLSNGTSFILFHRSDKYMVQVHYQVIGRLGLASIDSPCVSPIGLMLALSTLRDEEYDGNFPDTPPRSPRPATLASGETSIRPPRALRSSRGRPTASATASGVSPHRERVMNLPSLDLTKSAARRSARPSIETHLSFGEDSAMANESEGYETGLTSEEPSPDHTVPEIKLGAAHTTSFPPVRVLAVDLRLADRLVDNKGSTILFGPCENYIASLGFPLLPDIISSQVSGTFARRSSTSFAIVLYLDSGATWDVYELANDPENPPRVMKIASPPGSSRDQADQDREVRVHARMEIVIYHRHLTSMTDRVPQFFGAYGWSKDERTHWAMILEQVSNPLDDSDLTMQDKLYVLQTYSILHDVEGVAHGDIAWRHIRRSHMTGKPVIMDFDRAQLKETMSDEAWQSVCGSEMISIRRLLSLVSA